MTKNSLLQRLFSFNTSIKHLIKKNDGRPFVKEQIEPITCAMARRKEEKDEVHKTLLLGRVKN